MFSRELPIPTQNSHLPSFFVLPSFFDPSIFFFLWFTTFHLYLILLAGYSLRPYRSKIHLPFLLLSRNLQRSVRKVYDKERTAPRSTKVTTGSFADTRRHFLPNHCIGEQCHALCGLSLIFTIITLLI